MLAELVAECDVAVLREDLAHARQFTHRVRPEVQDMTGQDQADRRVSHRPPEVTGYQGQAAVIDGECIAASRAFRTTGDLSTPTTEAAE